MVQILGGEGGEKVDAEVNFWPYISVDIGVDVGADVVVVEVGVYTGVDVGCWS